MSILRRTRHTSRTPERWIADLTGRGAVLGEPGDGEPGPRVEAMRVLGGIARDDLMVVVLSGAVLVVRGGSVEERELRDATRVTWLGDDAPGVGDGRVSVAEPGGVLLRRPTDPMQRERRPVEVLDDHALIGRAVDDAGGARVEEAVLTPWAWALLLDDGSVVAATNLRAPSASGRPATVWNGTELACDAPVVVDRSGAEVTMLEVGTVALGPPVDPS